jgi:DNA-binding response OmpR family regulator
VEKARVILVEDDPDIAWIVQLQLRHAGFEVFAEEDGISGLHRFLTDGADLLLLDIDLPGLNGWDVYRRVRATSEVPIIMLTAYAQDRYERPRDFGQGPDRCVEKPFTIGDLKDHIADALGCQIEAVRA